jgi:ABC-type transport system involved in multi-copper enzyme maturation permease subunit
VTARIVRVRRGIAGSVRSFGGGIVAVGAKELRGRMRGRRAFVVLTLYLLLLSLFAWGIYQFQRQIQQSAFGAFGNGVPASAAVGQAIFSGLLVLETLLVLVLAPALTAGAISMEREKQTLDLLVTTPLATLSLVLGKLFSALTYVFLLILASIPLASIVFTFGGVGPDDLVRGYVFLFALAFGTGAIALFFSALLRRTQPATVMSYLTVLAVTLGATVVYVFWFTMARDPNPRGGFFDERQANRTPPEAVLWFNPFVADADVICGTSTGFDPTCGVIAQITGDSRFATLVGGASDTTQRVVVDCPGNAPCPVPPDVAAKMAGGGVVQGGGVLQGDSTAVAPDLSLLDTPRDRFWPRSAAAFVGVGALLTLLASQLVSPTRRLRVGAFSRRRSERYRRLATPATAPAVEQSAGDQVTT